MQTNSFWPTSGSWQRYWPSRIIGLIGAIQTLVSFALLGIHTGIVVIGIVFFCIGTTSWYVMGFVCWAFFFACWISVFCVSCCNRSSVGCATYTMIKNILAFIFSAVLIDFDRKFIEIEGLASLYSDGTTFCSGISGDVSQLWAAEVGLAKGQLAGAVIILVSSLVFIGIYIYVYIRALRDDGNISIQNFPVGAHRAQTPRPMYPLSQQKQIYEGSNEFAADTVRSNHGSQTVVCHNCGATIEISQRF